ncbi:SDR family oxidoreductase [Patescibacteria group bacterium]|nr:SDR family oxidoreductase [Patescibacteria group bacterium]
MNKKINFRNKTALITGATQGIGECIANSLWELGCNIIATGLEINPPKRITKKTRFNYHQLDFLDPESLNKFLDYIKGFNNIDILINNAGICINQPIDEIAEENWYKVLQVNLTGPMILIKTAAKIMKKKKNGKILNISSIFGVVSKETRNAYSASKSGLIGLTRATSLDLAKYNILVNALCPGFTLTKLTKSVLGKAGIAKMRKTIPLQQLAKVDDIANVALFLCSDLNTYITGQTIIADGGFTVQ